MSAFLAGVGLNCRQLKDNVVWSEDTLSGWRDAKVQLRIHCYLVYKNMHFLVATKVLDNHFGPSPVRCVSVEFQNTLVTVTNSKITATNSKMDRHHGVTVGINQL